MNTTTRFFGTVSIALATLMTACTDAEQPMQDSIRMPLNVNIHSGLYTRGGVISESYLPESSVVGLFLQGADGSAYDNVPYDNIPYVATGSGATQTWAPQSADKQILLSATEGKAYAYYPYNAENTSFSSIHLDASRQDDVMYTSTASTGLNDKNADASFELQHALAVMKVKVKKGSYTGAGNVTSCSISGSPIGLTGTLDGTTGNLSGVTQGKVSADKSYTISNTATDHDIIFVPTTTSGQVTVGLTMDGKEYTTTTTSSETFQPNQRYTLNLTVDDSGATLSGIQVGNWTMSGEGNSIVTAGGYKITFEGNYQNVSFSVSDESNGTITIAALAPSGYVVNLITGCTGASLSQSLNQQTRIIKLSNFTSDVTITMNGISMTYDKPQINDGVYAIKDNLLVPVADASASSYDGVAIAINNRLYQISNKTLTSVVWSTHYTDSSADIAGLLNYRYFDGSNTSGTVDSVNDDYTTWEGAISDFTGEESTFVIFNTFIGGVVNNRSEIADAILDFRSNSSYNQGFDNWFLPSLGELTYMYKKRTDINSILAKVSGAAKFLSTQRFWSITEENNSSAWCIEFNEYGGSVATYSKSVDLAVKLLRRME